MKYTVTVDYFDDSMEKITFYIWNLDKLPVALADISKRFKSAPRAVDIVCEDREV